MSFLSHIDPTLSQPAPSSVGAIPIITRALKLLDEVDIPQRLRNHYRSRIAKYKRESLFRALVFKLENIKLENIKVKSQRALYNYVPKQCEVHLNVWQERNNENTKGRASFKRDGAFFVLAKTIRVVLPVKVFESLGTEQYEDMMLVDQYASTEMLDDIANKSYHTDKIASIANACRSGTCLLEIISKKNVPSKNVAYSKPLETPLHGQKTLDNWVKTPEEPKETWIDPKMTNKYLTYTLNPEAKTFGEMFLRDKYYYQGACGYTALSSAFATKINSRIIKNRSDGRCLPHLDFKWIFQTIFPGTVFPGVAKLHEHPLSFQHMVIVCKKLHTGLRAFDYRGNLIGSYAPDNDNHHLKSLSIIISNGHAFHVTDSNKVKQLTLKLDKKMTTVTTTTTHCSAAPLFDDAEEFYEWDETYTREIEREFDQNSYGSYFITKKEPRPYSGTISSVDELYESSKVLDLIKMREKKDDSTLKLLWRNTQCDLANLITDIHARYGYLPKVRSNENGMICSVEIQAPGFFDNQVIVEISSPDYGAEYNDQPEETIHKAHAIMKAQTRLRKCNSLPSHYHDTLRHLLINNRKAPPTVLFKDVKKAHVVDITKCYTGIVIHAKRFPNFDQNDTFEQYDGHEIEDYSLYLVVKPALRSIPNNIEFPETKNVKFGKFIKGRNLHVIGFIRPSFVVPNEYVDAIKNIFSNPDLTDVEKKTIPNANWGEIGRLKKSTRTDVYFTTLADAHHANSDLYQNLGEVTEHGHLFRLHLEENKNLIDGFAPIQHWIYDETKHHLAKMAKTYSEYGVVGCNTDCIYLEREPPPLPKFDGMNPRNFGRLKYDGYKATRGKMYTVNENNFVPAFFEKPTPLIKTYDDEFHIKYIPSKHTCILGMFPGCGKSTLCAEIAKQYKNVAVVCPSNYQASKFENGMTLFLLCGKILTPDKDVTNGTPQVGYDLVIIEEAGQYNTQDWRYLKAYMKANPQTRFICNGDHHQIEPVERNWNPCKNKEIFFNNLIGEIFPVHIHLTKVKRFGEQFQATLDKWYDAFWVAKLPVSDLLQFVKNIELEDVPKNAVNIAYTNEMIRFVNTRSHTHKDPYYVGQILVKFGETAIKQRGREIKKNYMVEVVKWNPEGGGIVVSCSDKDFEFKLLQSQLDSFDYTYAFTGHKMQGSSFDEPVVIYESRYMSRNWLWVAMTRSRDLNKVFFCAAPTDDLIEKTHVDSKIKESIVADRRAERIERGLQNPLPEDYVTSEWIYEQSENQEHKCYVCKEPMSTKNDTRDTKSWSIDRVNSDFYHSQSNCRLACHACNCAKKQNPLKKLKLTE